MPVLLHVGSGPKTKAQTTPGFQDPAWREIRLDIDPGVAPDVVAGMTDMSAVASASVDAVFSSHNIEHLYAHEVPRALGEFRRVLAPSGFAVITCPDLQSVAQLVAEGRLLEPAYSSPAGPIAPLDIIYGFRRSIAAGNHFMAHRCGFTQAVLKEALGQAGFASVLVARRPAKFELWAVASLVALDAATLRALTERFTPLKLPAPAPRPA